MATPTNLPGSFSVGQTLTSAQMNALRGAFRILQVVTGTAATQTGSTSTTFIDTGLSATITPQSTSSLILVAYSQTIYTNATGTGGGLRLVRNGTTLRTEADLSYGTNSGILVQHGFYHLDTPSSVSALTYKTQFNRGIGAGTVFVAPNNTLNTANIVLFEVSA